VVFGSVVLNKTVPQLFILLKTLSELLSEVNCHIF